MSFSPVQAKAFAILDRPRLDRVAAHLAKTARFDEVALQWEHVEKTALQFKRHLRPLLQAVEITASEPEAPLMLAIEFLQGAFAKGHPLSQCAERAIPTRCISKRFRRCRARKQAGDYATCSSIVMSSGSTARCARVWSQVAFPAGRVCAFAASRTT